MATTFVLHGGATSKESTENDLFFRQFSELAQGDSVKILMCYWAREKENWSAQLEKHSSKIKGMTTKNVSLSVANNPADLFLKLKDHDVLYVDGGDAELIEPFLPKLDELSNYLENKVYLGSSMGAFIASKAYVLSFDSQDDQTIHNGLDLLPFNTLCHWNVENKKQIKLNMLRKSMPNVPVITLDESKFVTIYF